jgi:predicted nucleic acid-binding protein
VNHCLCVDASVAAKWLIPEPDREVAWRLLEDALREGTAVVVPPHLPVEVASAIYKHVRWGQGRLEEARDRLRDFAAVPIESVSPLGLAERAMEVSLQLGWSLPYDGFYLALGEILDCEMWTADVGFHSSARQVHPRVRLLAEYSR